MTPFSVFPLKTMRFQMSPFSNHSTLNSVFKFLRFRSFSMETSTQKRRHSTPFSYENGVMETGPKTAFKRYRHILKTAKNVTVAEFELVFTRYRNNLKTVRDLTVRNSLQDFDAIERYLQPKFQSVLFQKRRKLFYFQNFEVFTRSRFQNVPVRVQFSKSTVFKMCRQKMCRFVSTGGLSATFFTVFKMCRHRVNAV